MKHENYENGFIAHNMEDELSLPCGRVTICSDKETVYYEELNEDGNSYNPPRAGVVPAHRLAYGATSR